MPNKNSRKKGKVGVNNLFRPVLAKTLGKAVEQSVKLIGGKILGSVLTAVVIGPGTEIIAAAAGTLVTELLQQTRAQNANLTVVLSEPLESASHTLKEVIAAKPHNIEEYREIDRRLGYASDNLQKAYVYASKSQPEMCLVIRAYQVAVCALKEGADPFLQQYLKELQDVSLSTRTKVRILRDDASAIAGIRSYTAGERTGFANVSSAQVRAEQKKVELYQEADRLEDYASHIEVFCNFAKKLASVRHSVVMSSELHRLRKSGRIS